ncbi:hypothetical protein PACID_03160 [Acidipropionibacterium acidipropionici ATCC 4875]|uniref:Uncharacterized protein n=1 Tax=Acidipropionibacterium acidipropionici (strain ATCC 4875 / DSM 20272 / JCM 6432 / NBRC 12425 / NCIMB 8070 / 4) TaxID=1171373 RepID=K7SFV7_ACIA4|nr:hypothetical protein PACID_03160 [Acidipropionibacterium acidipropionici ATCC 4875]
MTITYADGTTSKATLTVGDWFTNTAGDGWSLVATAPYWNRPTGSSYPRDHKVSCMPRRCRWIRASRWRT